MKTREVEIVRPDDKIEEAAEKMKTLDVGAIPACDRDRLMGIITDRDITVRIVAARRDLRTARVRDAMTQEPVFCFEDQDIEEAAKLMEVKQVRRLPILNQGKRLVGIVSLGDLAVKNGGKTTGEALRGVSEPAQSKR